MPQTGTGRLQHEHFLEVTDHELREKLSRHLPEAIQGTHRIASLTWCLHTKKWLIKAVRKPDEQQAAPQAQGV